MIKYLILALFIVGIVLIIIDTNKIKTKKYNIKIDLNKPIKIVYFSDLHLGTFLRKKELDRIVRKLVLLDGDIYVFGGDLIGKKIVKYYSLDDIKNAFLPLKDKMCLAVSGNHEYQYDKFILDDLKIKYLNAMGFKVLNDELVSYNDLSLYGLKDSIYNNHSNIDVKDAKVVISHEGDIIDSFNNIVMLSGHTHGGQIKIPFLPYYKPKLGKKYLRGLYEVGNNKLIVSNGLGFGKMRIRLFAKRNILVVRID